MKYINNINSVNDIECKKFKPVKIKDESRLVKINNTIHEFYKNTINNLEFSLPKNISII